MGIKKRSRIIAAVLLIIVLITAGCSASPSSSGEEGKTTESTEITEAGDEKTGITVDADYAGGLFDTDKVHTVEIGMSPEDWKDLMARPTEKIKYKTDVTIDGEQTKNVSCSTKGNSSLHMVKDEYGIDRYSLKINFGKYEKGQTFHGLHKLNLNNSFMDSTYLKDYLCYNMFRKARVDGPLCSFAWVTVNGEPYGLFQAVEEVDEGFLERTGRKGGVLYKPDSEKLDAGGEDFNRVIKDGVQVEDYAEGAELGYRGEKIEDYPDIFNYTETKSDDEDKQRVIRALKGISEGEDLDKYLYTDELAHYFAVQNFVLNHDGYTGAFLHNYYLCEKDGKLTIFPWDYNLAFAALWERMTPEQADATMLANYGIDTPLLGAEPEQRPMWKLVTDNDSLKEKYHRAMDEFLTSYFESGEFERETNAVIDMIRPYVEKDPTAFYSADRFSSAAKALCTFCMLRAESIRKQLDGDLSTETKKQQEDDQVDVHMMTIEDLS